MRPGVLFAAGLLAASGLFTALAAGLSPGSRVVPIAVAAPVTALLLVQLAREFARHDSGAVTRSELAALGWVAALAGSVLLAGLLAGPGLFVAFYLRGKSAERWPTAIVGGAATAIIFWLLATRVLGAAIPHGLAGSLLGPLTGR